MKILIEISDQQEAELFLTWMQNRGGILLRDHLDARVWFVDKNTLPSVYIVSARELSSVTSGDNQSNSCSSE